MRLANPVALALLGLALPVVALHVLRPQRRSVTVSSTMLWRSITTTRPATATKPWQRLRPSWLLAAQLAAVALLALAAARPVRSTPPPLSNHTVFVVDTSGSMAAVDGSPTRLAAAAARVDQLAAALPAGAAASLVVAGVEADVPVRASRDRGELSDALATMSARGARGQADFAGGFAAAEGLQRPGDDLAVVLVSDGGLTDVERAALPPGTRYEQVGERSVNRAISRLTVEDRGSSLRARVTLRNTGGPAATQTLRLVVDGLVAAEELVELEAGATVDRELTLTPGTRVEARLDGEDLLAADDAQHAVVAGQRGVRVLVAGPPNRFLDDLFAAFGGLTIERVTVAAGGVGPSADGFDLAVYDQVSIPTAPGAPVLAIAPPGGFGPVKVIGVAESPVLVPVTAGDELLAGLDVSEVLISAAQRVDPGTALTLAAGENAPLVIRGSQTDGQAFVYVAFPLGGTNFPLLVAYPLFMDRVVDELTGAARPSTSLVVGQPLPVPPGREATVLLPGGRSIGRAPADPALRAVEPGFVTIVSPGQPDIVVAVNAPQGESTLQPSSQLPVRPAARLSDTAGEALPAGADPRTPLLVLAVLLVVLVLGETVLQGRRRGVGRAQWGLARVARLATLGLVAAAVVGPTVRRHGTEVATVFVLDSSDSLGADGRAAVLGWAREAIATRPAGARRAVVRFGGDARVERPLEERSDLGDVEAVLDSGSTDLAAALRLASGLLPEDARRRVVIVSDGRQTTGDAAVEVARLRKLGAVVDTVVVDPDHTADVAVASVKAPSLVRQGDEVKIEAAIDATEAGPVTISLRRDGAEVSTTDLELAPGRSDITLTDRVLTAGAEVGLARYTVEVRRQGDPVSANDAAYLGVRVDGPARVLVVEGSTDSGPPIQGALAAGGIPADLVQVENLPPLDRLASYAAVVLADVDARRLAPEQVAALTTTTRDLGRGMVVVGGPSSFGPGGYLGTEFEDLLPVTSEIDDPTRRQAVAEVLAIDTSGSMGSCHCSGASRGAAGLNQNRIFGGVNKTDLSRSAAARAIEALRPNDEVGILSLKGEPKWVVDLAPLPPQEVTDSALRALRPDGATDLSASLVTAAEALRGSKAALRHILLFTDGFSPPGTLTALASQAGELRREGITVSVVATGEGADMATLEAIATAGGGRFYPGKNLLQVPDIIVDETMVATREFIKEGEFVPRVNSASPMVANLIETPPLLGYVATTAKPTATTHLRIGDLGDPLLASWQAGLGTVAVWTSDSGARWSQTWTDWEGFVPFWTTILRESFPVNGDGTLRSEVVDGQLRVAVESVAAWPDGVGGTVRVGGPDGVSIDARLERVSPTRFEALVPASEVGTYGVAATLTGPGGTILESVTTATRSYGAEYLPGPADAEGLARLAVAGGGVVNPEPASAFAPQGLAPGVRHVSLRPWLLLAAALLWPLAVALSRLAFPRRRPTDRPPEPVIDLREPVLVGAGRSDPIDLREPVASSVVTSLTMSEANRPSGEERETP